MSYIPTHQYYQWLYMLRTDEGTRNEDGDFTEGEAVWYCVGVCREETNGRGSTVRGVDGKAIVFSSLIQMPSGSYRIPTGAKVIVATIQIPSDELIENMDSLKASGRIVAEGECMKFDNGRLHCRMWI